MSVGRPTGTKNVMRTLEEKEQTVLKYLNGNIEARLLSKSL